MSDLISRQAAIDALNEVSEHYTDKGREWHPHINFMLDAIKDLPSAQPEQKKGKWERNDDGIMIWWECSECHHDAWYDREELTNYCPNCGAKMVTEVKE